MESVTAREIADQGQQLWDVERMISHTGSLKNGNIKSLKFKVKWIGSDEITDEPWSGLFKNRVLHLYLIDIGQSSHIPYKYRSNYPDIFSLQTDEQTESNPKRVRYVMKSR